MATDPLIPPPVPPAYDPDLVAAIHEARADLYEAQAARRRVYLLTGVWVPQINPGDPLPREGEGPPPAMLVDHRRGNLDTARELARGTATPKGTDDADL